MEDCPDFYYMKIKQMNRSLNIEKMFIYNQFFNKVVIDWTTDYKDKYKDLYYKQKLEQFTKSVETDKNIYRKVFDTMLNEYNEQRCAMFNLSSYKTDSEKNMALIAYDHFLIFLVKMKKVYDIDTLPQGISLLEF